ncbi:CAP domain-containing protein [Roseicyclus elongatus]|uniref:CAP domain-containing protein n=1 Tax=Roseicyclus elongatus TaxID=159346 RepID=UPI0018DD3703|nr:CAP domain-containing protein [Roseibacterium elongatum]
MTGLSACANAPGTTRLSAEQSLNIASAGTQISLQRAQAGIVRPLAHSSALQAAAAQHAEYLSRTGGLSHDGQGGSTAHTRVTRTGYDSCRTAENIARGQSDLRTVLSDWTASAEHRRNMLDPRVTDYGIARAGSVWVLVLARPC